MKDDEVTMFEKIKVSKSKIEILWLFFLMIIFFSILVVLGGLQYIVCLDKNPETTLSQCFSLKGKK